MSDDGRQISNAKIESTRLGYDADRGLFTCWLMFDYGSSGQGFGGYVFDDPPAKRDATSERRALTGYGVEFLKSILRVAGADTWEDLPGRFVRVDRTWSRVHRIGHLLKDDWFDPAALAATFWPERES